jgi:hypothetical protein
MIQVELLLRQNTPLANESELQMKAIELPAVAGSNILITNENYSASIASMFPVVRMAVAMNVIASC